MVIFIYLFILAVPILIAAFGLLVVTGGIQFPDQGSNPGPLHWECGILTTGPTGRYQFTEILFLTAVLCSHPCKHRISSLTPFLFSKVARISNVIGLLVLLVHYQQRSQMLDFWRGRVEISWKYYFQFCGQAFFSECCNLAVKVVLVSLLRHGHQSVLCSGIVI